MTTENKLDNKIIKNYVSKLDRFDKKKLKNSMTCFFLPVIGQFFQLKRKTKWR